MKNNAIKAQKVKRKRRRPPTEYLPRTPLARWLKANAERLGYDPTDFRYMACIMEGQKCARARFRTIYAAMPKEVQDICTDTFGALKTV